MSAGGIPALRATESYFSSRTAALIAVATFTVPKSSRVNLSHDVVTVNFGWRHKLTEHYISLGSLGHEVNSGEDAPLALTGCCGVQLL